MNKNTKGLITVLAIVAIAFTAWHFTHQNVKSYAKMIVKLGGSAGYATLLTFEEGFLKAWAKALTKGKSDFTYKEITYNTQGGKKL